MTSSFKAFFTSSRAPISSNFTPISPEGTTAETKLLSYSSLARFCGFYLCYRRRNKDQQPSSFAVVYGIIHQTQIITFRLCEGFLDSPSCSFNLEIAVSKLQVKKCDKINLNLKKWIHR